MASRLAIMLELERRGKLPAGKSGLLAEARRRGLVPAAAPAGPNAQFMDVKQTPRVDPGALDYVKAFGAGANRAMADVIDLPGNIINRGLDALGVPGLWEPSPTARLMGAVGIPTEAPRSDTFGTRLANRAGSFAPFMVAGPMGSPGAIAGQAAMMGGSALSGQLAEEGGLGPGWQMAAEIAGGMGPGSVGRGAVGLAGKLPLVSLAVPAARGAMGLYRKARGLPLSPAQKIAQGDRVAREFQAELGDAGRANLEEAEALMGKIPGFRPTLTQATDVPSFKAREEELTRVAGADVLNRLELQKRASTDAVLRAADEGAPIGNADDLVEIARDRIEAATGRLFNAEGALEGRARGLVATRSDRSELGGRLRDALAKAKKDAMARYGVMREAVGNDPVPYGSLRDEAKGIIKNIAEAIRRRSTPDVVEGLAARKAPEMPEGEFAFKPKSLGVFLASRGGIREGVLRGELGSRDIGARSLPGLVRKDGATLEDAARAAWEDGYYSGSEPPSVDDFLNDLALDLSGRRKKYAADDLQQIEDGGAPVDEGADAIGAQELLDVDRDINRAMRLYARQAEPNVAYGTALYEARTAVDNMIGQLPEEAQAAYAAAQKMYATEVAPNFRRHAALQVLAKQRGDYATANESVAGAFFRTDASKQAVRSARQFNAALGNNPAAMADLEASVLDDMTRAVVSDGLVDAKKLARWRSNHGEALAQFPTINRKVADLQSAIDAIAARRTTLLARRHTVEKSVLAGLTGKSPEQIAQLYIKSPKDRLAIQATIRNSPEGKRALAAAAWENFKPAALGHMDPREFAAFLSKHRREIPIGSEHVERLFDLSRAMAALNRVGPSRATINIAAETDPLRKVAGMTTRSIVSTVALASGGMLSGRFAAMRIAQSAIAAHAEREAVKMWGEAIIDPEYAQNLLRAMKTVSTEKRAPLWRGLLLGIGANYVASENEPMR